jgi:nucleotide-binding universal stress UspA family protein
MGGSVVKVTTSLRQGNVVQEILAHADKSRSDLIVIGIHGRSGVQRLVLGSSPKGFFVCRHARCLRFGAA